MNVLGINYLLVADPATGTVTARRLGPAGLGDEEEGGESDWEEDEDGGVARRISPQLACVLSALLTLLCMMLIRWAGRGGWGAAGREGGGSGDGCPRGLRSPACLYLGPAADAGSKRAALRPLPLPLPCVLPVCLAGPPACRGM